jgi:hypothetical protein
MATWRWPATSWSRKLSRPHPHHTISPHTLAALNRAETLQIFASTLAENVTAIRDEAL